MYKLETSKILLNFREDGLEKQTLNVCNQCYELSL